MSNALYDAAAFRIGSGSFAWTAPKRLVLLPDGAAFTASHATVAALGVTPVASAPLANLAVAADGYWRSDHVLFPALAGAAVHAAVIVEDNADVMAAALVLFLDDAEELPFTPAGLDWLIHRDTRGWYRP